MSLRKWSFLITAAGFVWVTSGVQGADLTTFNNANVEARYTTSLGTDFGDTVGNGGQGYMTTPAIEATVTPGGT